MCSFLLYCSSFMAFAIHRLTLGKWHDNALIFEIRDSNWSFFLLGCYCHFCSVWLSFIKTFIVWGLYRIMKTKYLDLNHSFALNSRKMGQITQCHIFSEINNNIRMSPLLQELSEIMLWNRKLLYFLFLFPTNVFLLSFILFSFFVK